MTDNLPWTPERTAALKARWLAGESASQIADALGGTSRSAVIGKVHRLKLTGRSEPSVPRPTRAMKAPPVKRQPYQNNGLAFGSKKPVRATAVPIMPADEPSTGAIPVSALSSTTCSWIVDFQHENSLYCGAPIARASYCAKHAARAYVPTKLDTAALERSVRRFR